MWYLKMWIEIIVICAGVYLGDLYCGIRPDDAFWPDLIIKAAIIWFLDSMARIIFDAITKKRDKKKEEADKNSEEAAEEK